MHSSLTVFSTSALSLIMYCSMSANDMVYVRLRPTSPALSSAEIAKVRNLSLVAPQYSYLHSREDNGMDINATEARKSTLSMSILSPNQRTITR